MITKPLNYYPCFSCNRYDMPLIYFPGSENLLCEECAAKYYPAAEDVQRDVEAFLLQNKVGIL